MNLTKQQIETIYKVTNLLDCGAYIFEDIDGKLNEVMFKKDDILYFGVRYIPLVECWVTEWGYGKGEKYKGTDFPTFEKLQSTLNLIPVIE